MRVSTGLRGQHGIALLEALIAIVIVALGVLGVLGVQLRTLSDTQTAVRRAQAIRLIEDLSERMKANPSGLTAAVIAQYAAPWGAVSGAVPDCTLAAGCTAANLARYDVAQWKAAVRAVMPLGDANVFLVTDTASLNHRALVGVMVSWRENERERAAGDTTDTLRAPLVIGSTGDAGVSCPDNRICHLQYIQPTQRCVPYSAGDPTNPPVLCP